jgi:PleD family two-component response regulator
MAVTNENGEVPDEIASFLADDGKDTESRQDDEFERLIEEAGKSSEGGNGGRVDHKKVLNNMAASLSSRSSKVILAVDDSQFELDFIQETLSSIYNLRQAKTPLAAFGILHREHIDLVLLDIDMPGMSGLEFFERIRKEAHYRYTKTIFTTSLSDSETVKRALELGASGYILKPIDPDKLLTKVRDVLKS